jgi:hypothetical protein
MSRISYFLDNRLTDDGEVVSLTHRPRFTPKKDFFVLIYVRDSSQPQGWESKPRPSAL